MTKVAVLQPEVSGAIHAALKAGGLIDERGFLLQDARRSGVPPCCPRYPCC